MTSSSSENPTTGESDETDESNESPEAILEEYKQLSQKYMDLIFREAILPLIDRYRLEEVNRIKEIDTESKVEQKDIPFCLCFDGEYCQMEAIFDTVVKSCNIELQKFPAATSLINQPKAGLY